jgi:glycosyltransferase involved in cell wall biosynthesis
MIIPIRYTSLSATPEAAPQPRASPELLSIIVPVYNEERTVRAVLDRLVSIDLPLAREILVVDDGSTDGTGDLLRAAEREGLPVTVIRCERNGGKGHALRTGLARANGTIVAIQDADLELDPAQLGTLVQPIVSGTTRVVYGSRFLNATRSGPWLSVAANRFLTGVTNVLYGASLTDMETCYKVMRTDVARSLRLEANRFDIEPQITARLLRAGHRVTELPVRFEARTRQQGKKIGWRDGVKALNVLVAERFRSARSFLPPA